MAHNVSRAVFAATIDRCWFTAGIFCRCTNILIGLEMFIQLFFNELSAQKKFDGSNSANSGPPKKKEYIQNCENNIGYYLLFSRVVKFLRTYDNLFKLKKKEKMVDDRSNVPPPVHGLVTMIVFSMFLYMLIESCQTSVLKRTLFQHRLLVLLSVGLLLITAILYLLTTVQTQVALEGAIDKYNKSCEMDNKKNRTQTPMVSIRVAFLYDILVICYICDLIPICASCNEHSIQIRQFTRVFIPTHNAGCVY
ncbi:hypothetical protein RFI_15453 [Reticulomyxa filosa]|uniref:Uncharacterized protein n=1 Tax=Reticulomyxa filosa TaxID=46433 RepID=X6N6S5_RETFI|nr:hypothetical protein RFI_15453 [Reticulomyxa filosa]|eukprot:ETO21751.1 hypothetical protein RFI_15453 [Reticulomyxa filosa]